MLMMPSPFEIDWRQAVVKAVKDRGGLFARSRAEYRTAAHDADAIVLVRKTKEAEALAADVDQWILLDAPIDQIVGTVTLKDDAYPLQVYRLVAERLGCASWIMDHGGIRLDGLAAELDFPGLGRFSRSGNGGSLGPALDPGPLAVYRSVPPVTGATAEWPMDLFVFEDAERRDMAPPAIDLTGRGRVVVFGPRLDLPPGHWRVTGRFSLDVEDSDVYLKFQWGVGEDLETMDIMLQRSGAYEVSLEKSWATQGPAELRVWASNAHFLGKMEFYGATVALVGEPREAEPDPAQTGPDPLFAP
jgi:hypothetical protein